MRTVRVQIEGHYEVQEVSYGKDYVWQPAHALIECDCGRTMDAHLRSAICLNCGADHTEIVREVVDRHLPDEVLHPWHSDYEKWRTYSKDMGHASEFYEPE